MKKETELSVLVALLLLLTYGFGYWTGFSQAQKARRVIVALDATDTQQASDKPRYEPYFTKQNQIQGKVK